MEISGILVKENSLRAAVATVIAQGISVVLCILYVMRRVPLLLPARRHWAVGQHLYWELFSQSISMGLMSSIVSAGSVVLQYGINGLGTLVIAGHTAARKLFSFTDMPLTAMASACSTFVSQNYGANHPDRVRRGMRDLILYSIVVAAAITVLMSVGAEWMVRLVSGSSEPVVLENGARYLIWNAPFYAVLGVLLANRYALQSMGEKVLPLLSSVIEFLGKIVTAEEHNVIGGLGEAVCSLLSEKLPTPVRRVGVQDKFGCSGPAWDLLKLYGLDAATICKTAHEMLG